MLPLSMIWKPLDVKKIAQLGEALKKLISTNIYKCWLVNEKTPNYQLGHW
jgi:hypothetical protein